MYYPKSEAVIVVPANCSKDDADALAKLKKTYKGGKTIPSMINCGMKHAPCGEWNLIVFSKGWMRNRVDIKYSYFIETEKDILFPVTSHKTYNFVEENICLLMLHKDAFKTIGEFPDMENLETSKLIWANKAIEKKYKFKGVVGGKCF